MFTGLIIDDDFQFCSMLREYLAGHEIELTMQHDGIEGLRRLRAGKYDVALLDIMLPGMDGFAVLDALQFLPRMNVILLTALDGDSERIRGLERGADDYITKPINPRELLARIHALMRRSSKHGKTELPTKVPSLPLVRLDVIRKSVMSRQKQILLTDIEFAILQTLMQSPGLILSRDDLARKVFQRDHHPFDRSLDMHVSRLRRKLDRLNDLGKTIRTIRSEGYTFLAPENEISR